jgi:endoglucanase
VRLQIIQDKLVGAHGQAFSAAYMTDIRTVTDYALSLGLRVVLNAQTEVVPGFTRNESLPTAATRSFWQHILAYYKNNPRVILDLFNEPRNCSWSQWRAAMQGLLDSVRHSGARNTVWVEGRWWGSTLAGVPLLHGAGIVYSFHHPGSPWPGQAPVTRKTWDRAFGNLASRGIPVVDGEFVNYSAGYHWNDPAVTVPDYLRYLSAHHIGMTAWTLGLPGVLNSTTDLASATAEPRGCGKLVRSWFLKMPQG